MKGEITVCGLLALHFTVLLRCVACRQGSLGCGFHKTSRGEGAWLPTLMEELDVGAQVMKGERRAFGSHYGACSFRELLLPHIPSCSRGEGCSKKEKESKQDGACKGEFLEIGCARSSKEDLKSDHGSI